MDLGAAITGVYEPDQYTNFVGIQLVEANNKRSAEIRPQVAGSKPGRHNYTVWLKTLPPVPPKPKKPEAEAKPKRAVVRIDNADAFLQHAGRQVKLLPLYEALRDARGLGTALVQLPTEILEIPWSVHAPVLAATEAVLKEEVTDAIRKQKTRVDEMHKTLEKLLVKGGHGTLDPHMFDDSYWQCSVATNFVAEKKYREARGALRTGDQLLYTAWRRFYLYEHGEEAPE